MKIKVQKKHKKNKKIINLHQSKLYTKSKAFKSFIFHEYKNKLSLTLITATPVMNNMSKKTYTPMNNFIINRKTK